MKSAVWDRYCIGVNKYETGMSSTTQEWDCSYLCDTGPIPVYSRFHIHWIVSMTLMYDPCIGPWILHCLASGNRKPLLAAPQIHTSVRPTLQGLSGDTHHGWSYNGGNPLVPAHSYHADRVHLDKLTHARFDYDECNVEANPP